MGYAIIWDKLYYGRSCTMGEVGVEGGALVWRVGRWCENEHMSNAKHTVCT